MRWPLLLALLLSVASFSAAEAAEPLSFERGSWAKCAPPMPGSRSWCTSGATCGPCLVELPVG